MRRMGYEVQPPSISQYGGQAGSAKNIVKHTKEKLEVFKNINENMSMRMHEIMNWDNMNSMIVDFLYKLLQFGCLYFLGQCGVSLFLIILGVCLVVTASAWLQRRSRTPVCVITDPANKREDEKVPMWVQHPDMERTEWVNKILAKVWPRLEVWLTTTLATLANKAEVVETVEKMGCTGIRFRTVRMGVVPVRVEGVKIHNENRSEVVMDVHVTYNGDCHVELALEMPKPAAPVVSSLKNVFFEGTLRLQLNPLIKSPPLVGGAKISLLSHPNLDFELGGVAGILELPLLHQIVRYILLDQIERALLLPNNQYFSISEDVSMFCEMARTVDEPEGVLCITLVEAENLVNKDSEILGQGVSDPYTIIDFTADRLRHRFKSPCIKDDLNPVWNFICQVPVDDLRTVSDISLQLFDKDKYTKDDPLGEATLPKSVVKRAADSCKDQDFWKVLENIKKGSVRTRISWSSLSMNPVNHNDDQGLVIVLIDSCKNIFKGEETKPDVVVSVTLNDVTKVSSKAFGSCDPIFEDRMLLLANNPTVDDVKIDVIDIKNDKVAGSVCVELTQLLSQDSLCMMNQTFPLYSKNSLQQGTITISVALRYLHHSQETINTLAKGFLGPKLGSIAPQNNNDVSSGNIFGAREVSNQQIDITSSIQSEKKVSVKSLNQNDKHHQRASHKKSDKLINGEEKVSMKDLRNSIKNLTDLVNGTDPQLSNQKPTNLENGHTVRTLPKNGMVNGSDPMPRHGTIRKRHPTRTTNKKDTRPKVYLTIKYNKATSVISVVVHKVINLEETSHTSLPSPYVKTYMIETLLLSNKRDIYSKKKTKTKKNSLNPVFEETLEYFIPFYNLKHHKIEVSIFYVFCTHFVSILRSMCVPAEHWSVRLSHWVDAWSTSPGLTRRSPAVNGTCSGSQQREQCQAAGGGATLLLGDHHCKDSCQLCIYLSYFSNRCFLLNLVLSVVSGNFGYLFFESIRQFCKFVLNQKIEWSYFIKDYSSSRIPKNVELSRNPMMPCKNLSNMRKSTV